MENTENEQKLFADENKDPKELKAEKKDLTMPFAVIIAGALIAGSVYATGGIKIINGNGGDAANVAQQEEQKKEIIINPISKTDHIVGKADAPVVIVSYTDLECPFCKRFHETMGKIMDEYRDAGKVAWVYRQFPLDQLHSKARNEAEASECAGLLGGNVKFWEFIDGIFSKTNSNNSLDPALLPKIAADVGLNVADFESCLSNRKTKDTVQAQQDDGVSAGAQGTPYSVVLTKKGEKFTIDGAYPYELVKQIIDKVLETIK